VDGLLDSGLGEVAREALGRPLAVEFGGEATEILVWVCWRRLETEFAVDVAVGSLDFEVAEISPSE